MLVGWAYGAIYRDSTERHAALAGWLDFYNRQRPHGALSHRPPLTRPHELNGNNLLGSYTRTTPEHRSGSVYDPGDGASTPA